jgi:hypothetical protein
MRLFLFSIRLHYTYNQSPPCYQNHSLPIQDLKAAEAAYLLQSTPPLRTTRRINPIIEWIPAQRASTLITAREPLKQAAGVEQVLARLAAFVWHLLVRRYE